MPSLVTPSMVSLRESDHPEETFHQNLIAPGPVTLVSSQLDWLLDSAPL